MEKSDGRFYQPSCHQLFVSARVVGPSGKVFLFTSLDGLDPGGADVLALDPSGNGTLTKVADLPFETSWQLPAIKFAPDKILILDDKGGAWIMDMSGDVPTFQQTGSLGELRLWSNLVVLADGSVMASGGSDVDTQLVGVHNEVQIWNPETGVWTTGDDACDRAIVSFDDNPAA